MSNFQYTIEDVSIFSRLKVLLLLNQQLFLQHKNSWYLTDGGCRSEFEWKEISTLNLRITSKSSLTHFVLRMERMHVDMKCEIIENLQL